MSSIRLLTCGIATLAFTVLFANSIMAKDKPSSGKTGQEIFIDRCGACHGEDAKGNGPAVGMLRIAPGDLTLLTQRNGGTFPAQRTKDVLGGWADIGAHGSREMPIWGDLFNAKNPRDQQAADEQFSSLVRYLESIQQ